MDSGIRREGRGRNRRWKKRSHRKKNIFLFPSSFTSHQNQLSFSLCSAFSSLSLSLPLFDCNPRGTPVSSALPPSPENKQNKPEKQQRKSKQKPIKKSIDRLFFLNQCLPRSSSTRAPPHRRPCRRRRYRACSSSSTSRKSSTTR